MLTENRRGKIVFAEGLVEIGSFAELKVFFEDIYIIHIEHNCVEGTFTAYAISPHFDKAEQGKFVPEYRIYMHLDVDKNGTKTYTREIKKV